MTKLGRHIAPRLRYAAAKLEAEGMGEIEFVRACNGSYEDVPIQPAIAVMMVKRPDIDWRAVNEVANAAGLRDERESEATGDRPKDRTAAERMRGYRDKQRNADRNADRNEFRLIAAE